RTPWKRPPIPNSARRSSPRSHWTFGARTKPSNSTNTQSSAKAPRQQAPELNEAEMAEFSQAFSRLIQDERPGGKQFGEVITRLANEGVIVSGDSNLETELYEIASQIEDEVSDFFGLLGCTLYHNPKLGYFRLFPPAAKSPCIAQSAGAQEGESESAATGF